MRLYVNAKGEWVGTQAEAKKIAAIQIEVPTDKQGLMHFLNKESVLRNVQTYGDRGATEPPAQPSPSKLDPKARSYFSWALETLQRGNKSDAEEMLIKGLKLQKGEAA